MYVNQEQNTTAATHVLWGTSVPRDPPSLSLALPASLVTSLVPGQEASVTHVQPGRSPTCWLRRRAFPVAAPPPRLQVRFHSGNNIQPSREVLRVEPPLQVLPVSLGSPSCTCIGKNRAFQHSDGSCLCRTGFIFYNDLDFKSSTSDSVHDCQPEVSGRSPQCHMLAFVWILFSISFRCTDGVMLDRSAWQLPGNARRHHSTRVTSPVARMEGRWTWRWACDCHF